MNDNSNFLNLGADPEIENRPYWRYAYRKNFFEISSIARVDWESREIDNFAIRSDGLSIFVSRPMTIFEKFWFNPKFGWIRWKIINLKYKFICIE